MNYLEYEDRGMALIGMGICAISGAIMGALITFCVMSYNEPVCFGLEDVLDQPTGMHRTGMENFSKIGNLNNTGITWYNPETNEQL